MKLTFATAGARTLCLLLAAWPAQGLDPKIEVVNHHPFAIRQPIAIDDIVFLAGVAANGHESVSLPQAPGAGLLTVRPEGNGMRLAYAGADAGRLSWDLMVQTAEKTVPDFAARFEPLPLQFKPKESPSLYTEWQAESARGGFRITVRLRAFTDGFLDAAVSVQNVSATEVYGAYAAAVARWEHPNMRTGLLCSDNRMEQFDTQGRTRFSAGEGRFWSLQHGVDWLALGLGGPHALVLSSYSESPTVLDDVHSGKNKSPRFTGANIPQFKNEAQRASGAVYLITELVRENRTYRDRFMDNRMPDRGQMLVSESRVIFGSSEPSREQADRQFLAYNTYISREGNRIDIGVPAVEFGTSYFPYSTLGENFGSLKLPGQETDAFWPFSSDTVTHWREFAGDIRRDLRIAKAMGFTTIRLHYIDVIAKLPEDQQFEYLDFLFGELRHLKLRALFSTAFPYWTPEQIAVRVARYKDVIDRVEIENEVLIWGIPLDRPQYWARIYAAVRKAAPNVKVHLTSHVNTGIFGRLQELHVPSDAVSAHAYIDSLDAIPSGRGFALAVGNYARRTGSPAIFTEWNWRGLTRMDPEARAQAYPPIMENLLATRSIRELYQFQFQETMCVNPHTRKGIRHYELLWLSRRPKPEAFELMKLMDVYAAPDTPNRQIAVDHPVVDTERGRAEFHLENHASHALRLHASVEAQPGMTARLAGPASFEMAPGTRVVVPLDVSPVGGGDPGFYHVFLRLEGAGGLVRYGWAEYRVPGQPRGARVNLNRPLSVVYAENAPIIELEAAYLLAQTIESASGRPVGLYSARDLPANAPAVVAVGRPKLPVPAVLMLSNYDAVVDFVLSYWKNAKDSAARRVGLVEKELPAGVDVSALP